MTTRMTSERTAKLVKACEEWLLVAGLIRASEARPGSEATQIAATNRRVFALKALREALPEDAIPDATPGELPPVAIHALLRGARVLLDEMGFLKAVVESTKVAHARAIAHAERRLDSDLYKIGGLSTVVAAIYVESIQAESYIDRRIFARAAAAVLALLPAEKRDAAELTALRRAMVNAPLNREGAEVDEQPDDRED